MPTDSTLKEEASRIVPRLRSFEGDIPLPIRELIAILGRELESDPADWRRVVHRFFLLVEQELTRMEVARQLPSPATAPSEGDLW